jgi:hypothetical protein
MITAENIKDIYELQQKASALNLEDFRLFVKELPHSEAIIDHHYIDFNYKSIGASMCIEKECLCGCIDCYDEYGEWIDTIHCENVEFN